MMKRFLFSLLAILWFLNVNATRFSYRFNHDSLADALAEIAEQHPELHINFIYNELEKYIVSAKIDTDNPYDALRKLIGMNPVNITQKNSGFYLEALQHGRYSFSGRILGDDGEPVIAATVMLLAPKDSTVLTYGVTDVEGRFSIPCDSKKVIGKLSHVGYKTLFLPFNSFAMGNIRMAERTVALKNLNITADNVRLYADKSIYLPSSRQKNAATDAIDLLRHLAIPQISINPVDGKVSDIFGKKVAIYINNMEASQEELEGLRTQDVKKIEYLEFPDDPRFQGAEKVINFIVQPYIYGGYSKVTLNETVLNGFTNRSSIFSKFTFKKWTFDLFLSSENISSHHTGASSDASYLLKDSEGNDFRLNRKETVDKSSFRNDQFPITFRASYNSEKIQIRNTVGFTHNNTRNDSQSGTLTYLPDRGSDLSFSRSNPVISNSFAYNGQLFLSLPKGFSLNFTPKFSFTRSNDIYSYINSYSDNEIERKAQENAYHYRFDININKQLNQNHSISFGGNGGDWINRIRYDGTDNYSETFHLGFMAALANYTFTNRKVNVNARIGVSAEPTSINGMHDSWTFPFGSLNFAWAPNTHHSLFSYLEYSYSSPSVTAKVPDILSQNELMYISGNPSLKGNPMLGAYLSYTWAPSNILSLNIYGQFMGSFNRTVTVFDHFLDGKALLRTYINDGNRYNPAFGANATWRLLQGNLQLSASPRLSIFKSTGIYSKTIFPFSFNAQASYYLGKFFFQIYYQSPQKGIYSIAPATFSYPAFYHVALGWSNSKWNLRLTASNIFNKDWIMSTDCLKSPLYTTQNTEYGINYHSKLNLTATFTFGYGKKVMQGNEVEGQGGASSAIIK